MHGTNKCPRVEIMVHFPLIMAELWTKWVFSWESGHMAGIKLGTLGGSNYHDNKVRMSITMAEILQHIYYECYGVTPLMHM